MTNAESSCSASDREISRGEVPDGVKSRMARRNSATFSCWHPKLSKYSSYPLVLDTLSSVILMSNILGRCFRSEGHDSSIKNAAMVSCSLCPKWR